MTGEQVVRLPRLQMLDQSHVQRSQESSKRLQLLLHAFGREIGADSTNVLRETPKRITFIAQNSFGAEGWKRWGVEECDQRLIMLYTYEKQLDQRRSIHVVEYPRKLNTPFATLGCLLANTKNTTFSPLKSGEQVVHTLDVSDVFIISGKRH